MAVKRQEGVVAIVVALIGATAGIASAWITATQAAKPAAKQAAEPAAKEAVASQITSQEGRLGTVNTQLAKLEARTENVLSMSERLENLERVIRERPADTNPAMQSATTQLQPVFGVVGADGRVLSGKGFKVAHKGASYVVLFAEPFREAPVVVASLAGCSQPGAGCSDNLVHVTSTDRDSAEFLTTDSGGEEEPNSFSFIALASSKSQ